MNTTANELRELARHFTQFSIELECVELLLKAASELEELQQLQDEVDISEEKLFNY